MTTLPRTPRFFGVFLATLALSLLSAGPLRADVFISEFMAINNRALTDEDGDSSDWIEIRNSGPGTVNLGGYFLTDSQSTLNKWSIPSRTLAAGGYLIVFASGKDRRPSVGELHTNFSLNGNGEYLALVGPDGTTIQNEFAPYPEQFEDISYGTSAPIETQTVLAAGAACRWFVPSTTIPNWQNQSFIDTNWQSATTGIGYDTNDDYTPYFGTNGDVRAQMYNINTSIYLRVPFNVPSVANIVGARLKIQCDDGFGAYINNTTLQASDLAPASPAWNSTSTAPLSNDALAIDFREFNISSSTMTAGSNVLSIQCFNQSVDSSDLLLTPEIEIDYLDPSDPLTEGYMPDPTPNAANRTSYLGFVADTKFSMKRGFYEAPVTVEITTATPGATIRYTTDESEPTETNGTVYTSALTLTDTTVIRAAAFKENCVPTNVDTNTYIFPASVVNQPPLVPGFSTTWGTEIEYDPITEQFITIPVQADYGMDTDVTANPSYSGIIENALKTNLPVVCITGLRTDIFSTNGIYGNARESSTEIPISLEYFDPNSTDEFQQNAGIRIHGGNARSHPKKPFRLYFKRQYSKGKLDFPLFPGSAVDSFDQLILRPGGHDGWSVPFGNETTDLAPHALYMRDQFIRRAETEMGMLSPRGKYVHVYINGLYWGMYDLHERVNAQYFAAHRGGQESDWDVYHHRSTTAENFALVDGTDDAYVDLQVLAAAGIDTDDSYQAIQEYLDIDSYIDAMISRMWTGDFDWDGDQFLKNGDGSLEADVSYFTNKNWYGGRKSRNGAGKFYFFAWDAEMSMGTHLMVNLEQPGLQGIPAWFSYPPPQRITGFDSTRVNTPWAPAYPYNFLRQYAPFQRRFGDRLQKHLFGAGALSTAANIARAADMESTLELPIVAESARWGDVNEDNGNGSSVLTRDQHWRPEVNWLKNTFLAGRNATVIEQFRAIGLYPMVDAALFSINGGPVSLGSQVELSAPEGEIWYTTDGSEPFVDGVSTAVNLVDENATVKVFIPTVANGGDQLAGTWKGSPANSSFNDSTWLEGTQAIGYESSGTNYAPFINLDVLAMQGQSESIYVRTKFTLFNQAEIDVYDGLKLSVRYDDGFVAYLNGTEIARANAPAGIPAWNAGAPANRGDSAAEGYQEFEVTVDTPANLLQRGFNYLTFHMLNNGIGSSDLLLQAKLDALETVTPAGPSATAQLYTGPITLSNTQTINVRVEDTTTGEWSALSQAQFLVGTLASSTNVVISELNYRPREPVSTAETVISTNRDDYEWIEIMNVSAGPVDITNMRFSQGITFAFTEGGVLQPGGKVLVVRNRAAFLARYGAALDGEIAGEFENGTGLSNGGERITLLDATDAVIHTFSYKDNDPWPTAPNDFGHSLELVMPQTMPLHDDAASWTASLDVGGTPGSFEIALYEEWAAVYFDSSDPNFAVNSDPDGDFDGDGLKNFIEYVLGTDPTSGAIPNGKRPLDVATVAGPGGEHLSMSFRQRPQNDDFIVSVETSANGLSWAQAATETGSAITNGDSSLTRTFRSNASHSSDDTQLMRVRGTQVEELNFP